jgi:thiosulfate reductase cytochrome b subunit
MASLYLYPKWIRIWHLINALLFLVLIVTGLSMHYATREFTLIRFDRSVTIHNVSGILLTANYLFFLVFNAFSQNRRYYSIDYQGWFGRLWKQMRYYLYGMFKKEKAPFPVTEKRKFNPLQKLSYGVVLFFLMPVVTITGWALIYPEVVFIKQIFGTSGLHFTDLLHIISGYLLTVFMVVHIYMSFLAQPPGSSFRAMISGYHESH